MKLPSDVARCSPEANGCPVKASCARFTCKGIDNGRQSYIDASIMAGFNEKCDMHIDNGKDNNMGIKTLKKLADEVVPDSLIMMSVNERCSVISITSSSGCEAIRASGEDFDECLEQALSRLNEFSKCVSLTLAIWKDFDCKIEIDEVTVKD